MILQFYVNKIHSWYILCLDIRILSAKLYNFFVVGNTETGSPRSKCLYSKSIKEKKKKKAIQKQQPCEHRPPCCTTNIHTGCSLK